MYAITRKLQALPQTVFYPAGKPTGELDLRGDSGRRRLTEDARDETKWHGIGGVNLFSAWEHARWQT
eukprot:565943-Pyramimonas_sp.AAC.1